MITEIATEDRSSGRLKQRVLDCPSHGQIVDLLQSLDGFTNTMVVLKTSDSETLAIGGGNDGLCAIDFADDLDQFLTLRRNETIADEKEIVTGGQSAPFAKTFLIDLKIAVEMASNWSDGLPTPPEGFHWVDSREVNQADN